MDDARRRRIRRFAATPLIDNDVRKHWSLPEEWKLIAQMPFGVPAGEPAEKTFKPVDERIRVFR